MIKSAYAEGQQGAATDYGLAPAQQPENGEEDTHTGRNLAMLGAAALPWAGLIGQKPMIHKGKGELVTSFDDLKSRLQPGDIVLSGDSKLTTNKGVISAVAGNPKGYHAFLVDSPDSGVYESGATYRFQANTMAPNESYQILRPTRQALSDHLREYSSYFDDIQNSVRHGLERKLQRDGGYKKRTAVRVADKAMDKTYYPKSPLEPGNSSIRMGLKELLMPKLRSEQDVREYYDRMWRERDQLAQDPKLRRGLVRDMSEKILGNGGKVPAGLRLPEALENVCSTGPAGAMPRGCPVVPGKRFNEVMPTDFLRSEHFKPVARYVAPGTGKADFLLQHGPTMTRVGLGALGAAGIYGLSKLLAPKKEQTPEEEGNAPVAA